MGVSGCGPHPGDTIPKAARGLGSWRTVLASYSPGDGCTLNLPPSAAQVHKGRGDLYYTTYKLSGTINTNPQKEIGMGHRMH